MINKNVIKIIIPVVAVLIILESVLLVDKLDKNQKSTQMTVEKKTEEVVNKTEIKKINLAFESKAMTMKLNSRNEVSLSVVTNEDLNFNGFELFVKYDPEMVKISGLESDASLGKPAFLKVSDRKNVIVSTFLSSKKEGMSFIKDGKVKVLTFDVTPIKKGLSKLEISSGDSDGNSVTMFVDKVTSKAIPYAGDVLEVNVQ